MLFLLHNSALRHIVTFIPEKHHGKNILRTNQEHYMNALSREKPRSCLRNERWTFSRYRTENLDYLSVNRLSKTPVQFSCNICSSWRCGRIATRCKITVYPQENNPDFLFTLSTVAVIASIASRSAIICFSSK